MDRLLVILDDDAERRGAMTAVLEDRVPELSVLFFENAPDILAWLPDGLATVSLLSLDHDLGPTYLRDGERFDPGIGRDVTDYLETRPPACPVIIHSSNGPAADGMLYALRFADWTAERVYPHGDLSWIEADWIGRVEALLEGEE